MNLNTRRNALSTIKCYVTSESMPPNVAAHRRRKIAFEEQVLVWTKRLELTQ
jgi:hypothetical protein